MLEQLFNRLGFRKNRSNAYTPKYGTTGHQILDLEKEFGADASDYATLDSLIDKAKTRIITKEKYSKEDAVKILRTIDQILDEEGFRAEVEQLLFNGALKSKIRDCSASTYIYLGIAEAINLPLAAANAPGHLFVRWLFEDGQYINWETMVGEERSDGQYKTMYNIHPDSLGNVYLKTLTNKKAKAVAHLAIANKWIKKDNFGKGIKYYLRAIKNHQKAVAHYNRANILDPNLPQVYVDRALRVEIDSGHAIDEAKKAIKLDKNCVEAYLICRDAYHVLYKHFLNERKHNTAKRFQLKEARCSSTAENLMKTRTCDPEIEKDLRKKRFQPSYI